MGVSENRGTPKSSILIGFSIINHPFWGTPIFGNTHVRRTIFSDSYKNGQGNLGMNLKYSTLSQKKSHPKALLKMMFLFLIWDILTLPWRVRLKSRIFIHIPSRIRSTRWTLESPFSRKPSICSLVNLIELRE